MNMARTMKRNGWWYPYVFVGGFGVVLVVNLTLMYFATSTFNGLETTGAYEKGLAYNEEIAAAEAQAILGWQAALTVTPVENSGEGRTVKLVLSFSDRDAWPVDGLLVTGILRRPTVSGFDREVVLVSVGPGQYTAAVGLPMAGQWDVRLVASRGEDVFRLRERVILH